ncbi:MAG: MBL fold metallo-hydrolase [Chloroflexi bacterium]|nr:MBL fold metallo-hydrolase [Chloroflexota bacterium]MDL1944186.1 MBL fold metallo-hydrolase [Chloroflexi bacterium CFX2]
MKNFICKTCGTQYPESDVPPARCLICEDERQYVGINGQQWTTLEELRGQHRNLIKTEEPNLIGIGAEPAFAIGQRALLVQSPHGNILWDCLAIIDDEMIKTVKEMGGVSAIAISHPHYYSTMVEWSRAFDNAPIYLHAGDREWVMRPDSAVQFWEGATFSLQEGATLVHCGGHFAGSSVLHWAAGAEGRGVLLTGDTINVVMDRRYVSFMYSFPNLVPLPARAVQRIVEAVEPFAYDRLYSAWFDKVVFTDAKAAVRRSAERYINAIR